MAGASSLPAVFALLCAITYHHYDVVYGFRHRGVPLPRWVAGGRRRLGRAAAARARAAGRRRAAGRLLRHGRAVAVLFIGVTVAQWRHFGRGERPVYDDEEDEDD